MCSRSTRPTHPRERSSIRRWHWTWGIRCMAACIIQPLRSPHAPTPTHQHHLCSLSPPLLPPLHPLPCTHPSSLISPAPPHAIPVPPLPSPTHAYSTTHARTNARPRLQARPSVSPYPPASCTPCTLYPLHPVPGILYPAPCTCFPPTMMKVCILAGDFLLAKAAVELSLLESSPVLELELNREMRLCWGQTVNSAGANP